MAREPDSEFVEIVLELVRSNTRTTTTNGKQNTFSSLTKRGLERQIRQQRGKTRGILAPGRGTISKILQYLMRKGLIEIRIDGMAIDRFQELANLTRGKKWELIATERSKIIDAEIAISLARIDELKSELTTLKNIASSRKFTIREFVNYIKIKRQLFDISLSLYLKPTNIPSNVIEDLASDFTKEMIKLIDGLKSIRHNQAKYYGNFDHIVDLVDRRSNLALDLLAHELDGIKNPNDDGKKQKTLVFIRFNEDALRKEF